MNILEANNLKKYYGSGVSEVKALDGVTFSVKEGELVAVVGCSGSGKSTLLHMLGGLDYPTSGTVTVAGKELSKLNETEMTIFRRRNIGFVFQSYNLVPILSVYENIVLPVELDGKRIDRNYINNIMKILGIADKANNLPNQLSGGQQQRVAIARALAHKPKIIFADEPTAELDSATAVNVMNLFKKMVEKEQVTIVMTTHDTSLMGAGDVVYELEDGKLQ